MVRLDAMRAAMAAPGGFSCRAFLSPSASRLRLRNFAPTNRLLPALLVSLSLAGPLSTAHATIIASDDVSPANPTTWTNKVGCVGKSADGTLTVDSGSDLLSYGGYIGYYSGSTGVATVTGTGSSWTNSSWLYVGYFDGSGTLNITGGGAVTATSVSINGQSLLAIDVGNGSKLTVGGGNGTITNDDGTVRILAGASPAAGKTFTPIVAGTFNGTGGTYQAIGGTWNASSHVFTASKVQQGTSGMSVAIDLVDTQRVLIGLPARTWSVGASFAATTTSSSLTLTATAISGDTLTALQTLAGAKQSVLGGWDFTAISGYTAGDPVYLSLAVGQDVAERPGVVALRRNQLDGVRLGRFDV